MSLFLSLRDKLSEQISKQFWDIQAITNLVKLDPSLLTVNVDSQTLLMKLIDTDFSFNSIDEDGLTMAILDTLRYSDVYEDDLEKYRKLLKPSSNLISNLVTGGFEIELIMLLSNTHDSIIEQKFPRVIKNHYEIIFNFETFSINSLSENVIRKIRTTLNCEGLGKYTHKVFEGHDVDLKELSYNYHSKLMAYYYKYGKTNGELELDFNKYVYEINSCFNCRDKHKTKSNLRHYYQSDLKIATIITGNNEIESFIENSCNFCRDIDYRFGEECDKIVDYLKLISMHKSIRLNFDGIKTEYIWGAVITYVNQTGDYSISDKFSLIFDEKNRGIDPLILASLRNDVIRPFLGYLLKKEKFEFNFLWSKYIISLYGDDVKFQLKQFEKNYTHIMNLPLDLVGNIDKNFDLMNVDTKFLEELCSVISKCQKKSGYSYYGYHKIKSVSELFDAIFYSYDIDNYYKGKILSLPIHDRGEWFKKTVKSLGITLDEYGELIEYSEDKKISDFIDGMKQHMTKEEIRKKILEVKTNLR